MSQAAPILDASYCGKTLVEGWLHKNKWTATIGLLFGRYVKRYFVIDMTAGTFAYYSDATKKALREQLPLTVSLKGSLLGDSAGRRGPINRTLSMRCESRVLNRHIAASVPSIRRELAAED